jgi:hypothetical protein
MGLPPYAANPIWPNEFNPNNPPTLDPTKPITDLANIPYLQSLYYSRAFAREAQTMGGKQQ